MTANATTTTTTTAAAATALKTLATMQKLTLDAVHSASEKELEFLVLNRTAGVVRYDRASLWRLGGRARLLGVSGRGGLFAERADETAWRERLDAGLARSAAGIHDGLNNSQNGGLSGGALWLPLRVEGGADAGLVLERFSGEGFSQPDLKSLRALARGYEGAFRIFTGRGKRAAGRRLFLLAAAVAAVVLCLTFYRLPLRVVAPCVVVPSSLIPVNAPLDGVIREVRVAPGAEVSVGDVLYVYDDEVTRRELEASRKQLEVTRSDLERAAAAARTDVGARSEAVMLQNRLSLDRVRLEAVARRFEQLVVSAPESGVVVMGEPAEFSGRPVAVGEAVVKIAAPGESFLRISLPQDDRIDFDSGSPVRVVLNADSARTLSARLSYVAPQAAADEDGGYGFLAEAAWEGAPSGLHFGQRGTAILYGEKVRLGYWLFRKPLAAVRGFLGI